ncbi:MAG TPA: hypothetical protein VNI57_12950 [Candidatus Saccharimonadales bacterium]|nr:hypothetical protein [Candidatus Saccharimonadales bacterium]
MRRSKMGVWRVLALAALAVLLQAQLASTVVDASSNGRSNAQCRQACNDIKAECGDQCAITCGSLYPPGSTDYSICNSACSQACADDSQACKSKCGPHEVSPGEP